MIMHKFLQNKLWRDKAPDMLRAAGSIVHVTLLDDAAYEEQLKIKLTEEIAEVCGAQSREQLIEELADAYEVIDALCGLRKISFDEIRSMQTKKRDERGGFYGRTFVTIAEHAAGSFGERYCRAQQDKYPEIF
jgi:predicted house-cleaning noncanonical NTP pyrophosphatase (MazG superfamily)